MTTVFTPNEERLEWDQTNEVARGVLREAYMMPLSAIGLGAVGWIYAGPVAAIAWSVAMLISTACLITASYQFKTQGYQPGQTEAATRRLYFASLLQAAVAGGHLVMFWTPGADVQNLVLLLIFLASAMFAVSVTATSWRMLVAKIVFHIVVCEVVLLAEGGPTFNVLAALSPLYFGSLASSGVRTYQRSREALRLAQEREAMIAELTRANQAKTIFLANMSHELRTPLNAIIGFSELMQSETFGPHGSPKYLEYSADIFASGSHLLDLINDILDGARVDAGGYVPVDERFGMRMLMEECARLIAGRVSDKTIRLSCECRDDLEINADRRGVKQVLINLLANAVKFTPAHGDVSVRAFRMADGGASIAVSDNGPGIAKADLERIFESFGQGRHDVAAQDRGVGLGLAIVKGIMKAHGGSISVDSAPGRGTTMTARLPADRVSVLVASVAA